MVVKRRRTGNRKSRFFKRSARRVTSITGQASRGTSFGFRPRRLNIRKFKNHLWNDTIYKTHFRSAFDQQFVATTATVTNQALGYLIRGTTPNFWVNTGGAYPSNIGGAIPTFDSDIIIRGGFLRIALVNESQVETCRVRVFLMKSNKFPNNSVITSATMSNIPTTWDPSVFAGFREFGKVILMREMILPPVGNPFEVFFKLPVQKLDQDDYVTNAGNTYYWIACVSKMTAISALTAPIRVTYSHNLTFVGDAQ